MKSILLTLCGAKTYGLIRDLVSPEKPKDKSYDEIVKVVKDHLHPKPSEVAERFRFNCRVQNEGAKVKVHAITISRTAANLLRHINELITEAGLDEIDSESIVDIIEGHIGAGYGASTDKDHAMYQHIASATGVFCDPVYTGKGAKGLISELSTNPSRFKGERILFVHTGGIFDMCDGRMFDMFTNDKVHDWKDIAKSPADFFV